MGRTERGIRYDPLPSQRAFHSSSARFKGFSGPVGSGKSAALCHEAIRMAYLNAGRVGLLGAPTYAMLRDATQTALLEVLEENEIPFEFHKSENSLRLRDTGSMVLFRSLEEYERLRGTNLAWFGVDELTYAPEEAWLRLEARLRDPKGARLGGFAVWTPKGFDWVHKRFVAETVSGYEVIRAQAFENRHLLEQVPDFYERLKHSYDPRFYQQEVLGEYLNQQSGTVYYAFERGVHVRATTYSPYLPLLWALDFNVDPMCSVVVQQEGATTWVLDEIALSRATTREACEVFCERFGKHQGALVVYGDASGARMQTTGQSDYQIIRAYFQQRGVAKVQYRVPPANPRVRERVRIVNSRLRNAEGEVRMYVDPRCRELIKDFEQVVYLAGVNEIDKDRDAKRTHLSDALGYLLHNEQASTGAGERGQRLL